MFADLNVKLITMNWCSYADPSVDSTTMNVQTSGLTVSSGSTSDDHLRRSTSADGSPDAAGRRKLTIDWNDVTRVHDDVTRRRDVVTNRQSDGSADDDDDDDRCRRGEPAGVTTSNRSSFNSKESSTGSDVAGDAVGQPTAAAVSAELDGNKENEWISSSLRDEVSASKNNEAPLGYTSVGFEPPHLEFRSRGRRSQLQGGLGDGSSGSQQLPQPERRSNCKNLVHQMKIYAEEHAEDADGRTGSSWRLDHQDVTGGVFRHIAPLSSSGFDQPPVKRCFDDVITAERDDVDASKHDDVIFSEQNVSPTDVVLLTAMLWNLQQQQLFQMNLLQQLQHQFLSAGAAAAAAAVTGYHYPVVLPPHLPFHHHHQQQQHHSHQQNRPQQPAQPNLFHAAPTQHKENLLDVGSRGRCDGTDAAAAAVFAMNTSSDGGQGGGVGGWRASRRTLPDTRRSGGISRRSGYIHSSASASKHRIAHHGMCFLP